MAKTVNCVFCGKEMATGFLGIFGSESKNLELGTVSLPCCPECYAKYHEFASKEGSRIATKLENMCYDGKIRLKPITFSKPDIAKLFLMYLEDSKNYATSESYNGLFLLLEPTKDSPANTFLASEDLILGGKTCKELSEKSRNLLADEVRLGLAADAMGVAYSEVMGKPWAFSGEDISCIEYACGMENILGDIIALEITVKLNNFRQMTYKPCIIRGYITYKSSIFNQKKYRDAQINAALTALRTAMGAEHLPIVEVKEIK